MRLHYFFYLAVLCGAGVDHSVQAQEKSEESGVSVSLYQWRMSEFHRDISSSVEKRFGMSLNVRNGSFWKVAYCEEDRALLNIRDAKGRICSGQKYQYSSFPSSPGSRMTGVFSVFTESWHPSPEAAWIQVQGTIPFAVSRTFSKSEPVSVRQFKSLSVPLTLRGAAMDGGDVEVQLAVDEDKAMKNAGGKVRWVTISLVSPVRIGCMGFELRSENGTLQPQIRSDLMMLPSEKDYVWKRSLRPDELTGKEWTVSVTYATGLKKITVPVNFRSGLFGVEENGNPENKEGGK